MSSSLISFTRFAEIAQLVEHNLAKVRVASSSLVFRSCKENQHQLILFFCFYPTLSLNNVIQRSVATKNLGNIHFMLPRFFTTLRYVLNDKLFSAFYYFESSKLQKKLLFSSITEPYRSLAIIACTYHANHIANTKTFVLYHITFLQSAYNRS